MHSMLTEPVGPRSPDEILVSVYERTQRTRRRRRTQFGAGGALVAAMAMAGLLALRPSGEEARLHVVDRNPKTEEAAATRTPAATNDDLMVAAASTTTTTGRTERLKKTPPPAAAGGPVTTQAPTVTTTTTTLPPVRLLAEAVDEENDATPNDWYYDVVHGSMHLNEGQQRLVFVTSYRTSGGVAGNDRSDRRMRTQVTYNQAIYEISIDEIDGRLSDVEIDGIVCESCQAAFGMTTLTVNVPVHEFNAAVTARNTDAELLGAGSQITDLTLATDQLVADLTPMPADSSKDSGGVQ